MSNALVRGRTLSKDAVLRATIWRRLRIQSLLKRSRLSLSPKETSEVRRLTGRWDFWNHNEQPNQD